MTVEQTNHKLMVNLCKNRQKGVVANCTGKEAGQPPSLKRPRIVIVGENIADDECRNRNLLCAVINS